MSGSICDVNTISVIVKAFTSPFYSRYAHYRADDYADFQYSANSQAMRNAIGQSLLNQNCNSVNCRYEEDNKPPKFQYIDVEINEGLLYGCIRYYENQASDTENYYNSKIHFSLVRLQEIALERLLKKAGQKAPFGYNGHNIIA